jgi:glycopeptide antibiotics resistance protein
LKIIKPLLIMTLIMYLIAISYMILIKHPPRAQLVLSNWSYEGMLRNIELYTNIIPFKTIARDIHYPPTLRVIIYNVIAFIPLGILLPLIINHRYIYPITLLSGLFLSLFYELTQVITGLGSGDIDDVILNLYGTIIGYTIFRYSVRFYQTISRQLL